LSSCKVKFKVQTSAGKVMASIFWSIEGSLLVEFLERGAIVSSEQYVCMLKRLKQQMQRVQPNRRMNEVLLLRDNARPCNRLCTREEIAAVEWIVLPHPPYSPDLAPLDFHLFSSLKDALRGCAFVDDDELKHSMCEEL
jgi:hypothetical protein